MKFKKLFSIEVVHDYYDSIFFAKNENRGIIDFTPSAACNRLLQGIGARMKVWKNTLYVIIPTPDGEHPYIPIPDDSVLDFHWEASDSRFFQYTQLSARPQHVYYCNNASNAVRDGRKYLHVFHPPHDPGSTYGLAQFCDDGANDCLEALANLGINSDPNDKTQWARRANVTYLSTYHQMMMPGPVFTLPVSPAQNNVTIKISGWNHATNATDRLLKTSLIQLDDPTDRIQIDMRGFDSGRYRIDVNGAVQECYVDSLGELVQATGAITIYHNSQIPDDYALLTNDKKFRSPVFTIRLAPISTIWQYKVRTNKVQKIEDRQTMTVFESTAGGFTSKVPIRLSQISHQQMVMFYGTSLANAVEIKPLPLPVPGNYSRLNMNNTDFPVSTISLNY